VNRKTKNVAAIVDDQDAFNYIVSVTRGESTAHPHATV